MKDLPPVSDIDTRAKMQLWLALEALNQGEFNVDEFYNLLESHFALVSTWRELKQ